MDGDSGDDGRDELGWLEWENEKKNDYDEVDESRAKLMQI